MLKDLKFTLYEIFGYGVPGIVLLISVAILLWSICIPDASISLGSQPSEVVFIIILLSYLFGHIAQAVSNHIVHCFGATDSKVTKSAYVGSNIYKLVTEDISSKVGLDSSNLSLDDVRKICDETLLQAGITNDREVFIYREGFYRGLSFSLLVLSISLITRMFAGQAVVVYNHHVYELLLKAILSTLFVTATSTVLFFIRYKRFLRYRVVHSLYAYLVLSRVKGQLN